MQTIVHIILDWVQTHYRTILNLATVFDASPTIITMLRQPVLYSDIYGFHGQWVIMFRLTERNYLAKSASRRLMAVTQTWIDNSVLNKVNLFWPPLHLVSGPLWRRARIDFTLQRTLLSKRGAKLPPNSYPLLPNNAD